MKYYDPKQKATDIKTAMLLAAEIDKLLTGYALIVVEAAIGTSCGLYLRKLEDRARDRALERIASAALRVSELTEADLGY